MLGWGVVWHGGHCSGRLGGDKPFQLSPTTDVVYYNNGLTLVATANDKCVRIGAVGRRAASQSFEIITPSLSTGFVPKGEMDAVTSGPFAEYIATVEMRGQVRKPLLKL